MKKLFVLIIFLLMLTIAIAEYPDEIKSKIGLENEVNAFFDGKDVKLYNLEYSYEIENLDPLTTIRLNIKNTENLTKLLVYDALPEDLVENAGLILDLNTNYTVLDVTDTAIAHEIDNFGSEITIEYIIDKSIPADSVIDSVPLFIAEYGTSKKLGNLFVQYYDSQFILYAFILIGVAFIVYLILKLREIKKEKQDDKDDSEEEKGL